MLSKWSWHFGSAAFYSSYTLIFIDHGASITKNIFGVGSDPFAFVWFLAWWPWAMEHHINPLHCNLIWQPLGMAIMWVTSMPLLSMIAAPVTLFGSPVLAYNILILMAPTLSAIIAYFLCLYLTKSFPAALIGGYLFGFSAYEMAADIATLNLSFTLILPALILLSLTRLDGKINRFATVSLVSLMMVCEFLISSEIFATMIIFGFIAWLLACLLLPDLLAGLLTLLVDALIASPIVLFVLSPFLLTMLSEAHFTSRPTAWPYFFVTDLANLIIPTPVTAIGGHASDIMNHPYKKILQEQDGYLGLPLLAILLLYGRETWRTGPGKFLSILFIILLIASLGPLLWVAGIPTHIVLPWLIATKLPLISSALPSRFALYVSLVASIAAALWVAAAAPGRQFGWRLCLGFLACFALIPAPHERMQIPNAVFFQPGRVQAVLGPQPRLLVLPFGGKGPSSYWQVQNNFGYTQTGGYLGFPPAAMQRYPAAMELFGGVEATGFVADLKNFCLTTNTQYVVAGPGTAPGLLTALGQLNWPARRVDDVVIFTVPPSGDTRG